MADPFYNKVSLLLHGDGVNASTVFTDSGPTPRTVTPNGNAKISTAQSMFGGASMAFDGTGDFLTLDGSAGFAFGTGDFTIEGWVYRSAAGVQHGLTSFNPASTTGLYPELLITSGDKLAFFTNSATRITGTTSLAASTWYYWALSRVSGVTRLFLGIANGNASQEGTDFADTNNYIVGASRPTLGAGGFDQTTALNGFLDDVRVTKGVGRYTTSFAVPFAAFPNTLDTALAELVLAAPRPTAMIYGGANVGFTAPMATVEISDGGNSTLVAPMAMITGSFGGNLALGAPASSLLFVAHDSTGENQLLAAAPMATLQAYGGASAGLVAPKPTAAATATFYGLAAADLRAPVPTVQASGTTSAVASASLRAPSPNLVGYGGAVVSVTGPMGTLQATGTGGATGSIAVTCPLFQLVASGTANAHAEADLIAPMQTTQGGLQAWLVAPMARLVAIGSATVAASYEAYSLNLNHQELRTPVDELTHYTNFPFTHIVRYQNSYFGVAADGLYLLEGTTDYAAPTPTPIAWDWQTAKTDFGAPTKKTVESCYFGGRLAQAATVTLYAGEVAPTAYSYTSPRGADAQNYRQKFGRGIKSRYFAVGASGSGELDIDTLDFNVAVLARRI